MDKNSFFNKLDETFTKIMKKVVGDETTDSVSVVESLKDMTKKNIDKIKTVGLKETLLTAGTPHEKDVLYKEVVKREKQELKEAKKIAKEEKAKKVLKKKTTKKKSSPPIKKETSKKPKIKSNAKTSISKEKNKSSKKTSSEKTTTVNKITQENTKKSTEKKVKTTINKKQVSTTKKSPKKESKRDEKIALYIKDIKKHYKEVDEDFVSIIVKNLGPSIYKKDAEAVACSDPKELDTVRKNFLIKKLGITASQSILDAAIQDVCTELKGVRTKYRATFYYALAKKFKKESLLS